MSKTHNHYPALDGVRGIAMLLVFCAHTKPNLLSSGAIGVDLFFVLSGFLITTILLSEHSLTGRISLRNFYIRRALRLLPALFTMVAMSTIFIAIKHPDQLAMTASNTQAIALYYWNWVLVIHRGEPGWTYQWFFGHLWSLSVEEQFYIVWPFVVSALLMLRSLAFPVVLISGIAASTIARVLLWDENHLMNLYFRTDLHSDGLLFGALGAWFVATGWQPSTTQSKTISIAGAVSLATFIMASYFNLFRSGISFNGGWTALNALATLAIVSLVISPLPAMQRILSSWPLIWTGKISYGLYVWHLLVFFYCRQVVPLAQPWPDMTAILLSYVIAGISFYFLERRFLQLKKYFVSESTVRNSSSTGSYQNS